MLNPSSLRPTRREEKKNEKEMKLDQIGTNLSKDHSNHSSFYSLRRMRRKR